MIDISTNFGTFKVTCDDTDNNKLHVSDASTKRALIVLRDVYWWDKDGIVRALYKNKERILNRLSKV